MIDLPMQKNPMTTMTSSVTIWQPYWIEGKCHQIYQNFLNRVRYLKIVNIFIRFVGDVPFIFGVLVYSKFQHQDIDMKNDT